jgi:hypothetical protein
VGIGVNNDNSYMQSMGSTTWGRSMFRSADRSLLVHCPARLRYAQCVNVADHGAEALSRPVEALIRMERCGASASVSITAPFSYRYGSFGEDLLPGFSSEIIHHRSL